MVESGRDFTFPALLRFLIMTKWQTKPLFRMASTWSEFKAKT
jgi:hypothetical protein